MTATLAILFIKQIISNNGFIQIKICFITFLKIMLYYCILYLLYKKTNSCHIGIIVMQYVCMYTSKAREHLNYHKLKYFVYYCIIMQSTFYNKACFRTPFFDFLHFSAHNISTLLFIMNEKLRYKY